MNVQMLNASIIVSKILIYNYEVEIVIGNHFDMLPKEMLLVLALIVTTS